MRSRPLLRFHLDAYLYWTHDQDRRENPQRGGQVGGVKEVMYLVSVASLTALERK